MKQATKVILVGVLIIVILAAGGVAYWQLSKPQVEPVAEVRIGVLVELSGWAAKTGLEFMRNFVLEAEQINAAGGIKSLGGANITCIVADTACDPVRASTEAERLITVEHVDILWDGFTSAECMSIAAIAERYHVPYYAYGYSDRLWAQGWKYFFDDSPSTATLSQLTIDYVADNMPEVQRVALISENSEFGTISQLSKALRAKTRGLTVVVDELYDSKALDLSPLIQKIKAAEADAMISTGYLTDTLLIMNQMREYDVNLKAYIVTGGAISTSPDFTNLGGIVSEYVITAFSGAFLKKEPAFLKYYEDFEERWGVPPTMGSVPTYCHNIAAVLERAGSLDADKIMEAVHDPTGANFTNESGFPFKYDERGQNLYPFVGINQVQNVDGTLTFVPVWCSYPKILEKIQSPPYDYPLQYPTPSWDQR